MKTTENTNTTENPWLEGMKGSHDSSWLGRFWRRLAGVGVGVSQVADAYGQEDAGIEIPLTAAELYEQETGSLVHPSEDIHHPDYYIWNPPEKPW